MPPPLTSSPPLDGQSNAKAQTLLFCALVLVVVLPLFASQTMLEALDASFQVKGWATLAPAMTMLGYAMGLFLLVPLLDRVASRSLIARTVLAQVACLFMAAFSPSMPAFLAASFAVGTATSVVQMIVPAAASMAPPSKRGSMVGTVMSALMIGILLSRPLAAAVAGRFGWRMFFATDAALVSVMALLVVPRLTSLRPASKPTYAKLISSLATLVAKEPILRRRAVQQGLLMAGFSVFWGGISVVLTRAPFEFSQNQIALFALAGCAGVFAAPIAGRAGDRGQNGLATGLAHLVSIAAATLVAFAILFKGPPSTRLCLLVLAAFFLDGGVVADQALGRREINLLSEASRGRANGLYTGIFFIGSAFGAAVAGPAVADFGAVALGIVPVLFFAAAATVHTTSYFRRKRLAQALAS